MKKVFITGAGSGLGKDAAISLARRGHTVYASVRYEEEIAGMQKIASLENLNLYVFKLNILKEKDRQKIADYKFDVFINNAAIGDSGSVLDVDISRIEKVFDTNVFGSLKVIQLAIKTMIRNNICGRIVIVTSLAGIYPIPFLSPYCASKFALNCFAICLKDEIKILNKLSKKKQIDICTIQPGAYATGFNEENNGKKYTWMQSNSYFSKYVDIIKKYEEKFWNLISQKSFKNIVNCYVKSVEDVNCKFVYSTPYLQTFLTKLISIFKI